MGTPSARVLERDLKISPPEAETRLPHCCNHGPTASSHPRLQATLCAFPADKGCCGHQHVLTFSAHLDFSHSITIA